MFYLEEICDLKIESVFQDVFVDLYMLIDEIAVLLEFFNFSDKFQVSRVSTDILVVIYYTPLRLIN